MGDIRDVRKAMEVTQEMFQPLQEILVTVKAHGIDLATLSKIGDKSVQDYLDEVCIFMYMYTCINIHMYICLYLYIYILTYFFFEYVYIYIYKHIYP
jgi:hypothetical protein